MLQTKPSSSGWLKRVQLVVSWLAISGLVGVLAWGMYCEVSLWIRHDYTIAQITRFSRSNKFEKQIVYTYWVNGQVYEHRTVWNRQALPGQRYVVKYATYAPDGNDFLYAQPVPDSIQQDTGQVWRTFLRARQLFYRLPSHAR